MAESEIHKLGGLTEEQIGLLIVPIDARVAILERLVCANGRPALEDRMRELLASEIKSLRQYLDSCIDSLRKHVDDRDTHKENNARQVATNMATLIDKLTDRFDVAVKRQDERHESNVKRFGLLENKIAYASGVAAVVVVLAQHYWK